jgi:hypothetical protein
MVSVFRYVLLALVVVFILPVLLRAALWFLQEHPDNWYTADWSSSGLLPEPRRDPEPSIRVLSARTGGLKGVVSTHSWLVLKARNAERYDRYDVVGWGDPVQRNRQPADGRWYSNDPVIVFELKGAEAERLLPKVQAAIRGYQWSGRGSYRIWPGPNSNTIVATVLAAVPELRADLPPTAIGRDFPAGSWIRRTPLGGLSATLGGFAGITMGWREGVEIDLFGLVAGVRFAGPALILPAFGALGEGI